MAHFSPNPLRSLLDAWASFFITPSGKSIVTESMLDNLRRTYAALPINVREEIGRSELHDYLTEILKTFDELELSNDHPFNTAMCEFLIAHEEEMPDEGRSTLMSVRGRLGL